MFETREAYGYCASVSGWEKLLAISEMWPREERAEAEP